MKQWLILLLCGLPSLIFAQQPLYHRVKIDLEGKKMEALAALGIEADHGDYVPDKYFATDLSEAEIEQVKAAGFRTTIQIENVADWYVAQNKRTDLRDECFSSSPSRYTTPVNYTYGSMAGYYTYEEALAVLDDMASKYPNLISRRAMVSATQRTHENRPLFWLRISDNPNADESEEPEVLYTALHHCREVNALSQMLFFMWHLLENYDKDPQIKYLLDNTALYFVPIVNPDGYVFNQTTRPQGGGMWRKNRRNNGNNTFGVDLNRNYGHQWGIDNNGSSPNSNSDTYRGPGPFSEPETQMLRDFCLQRRFVVCQNYHTFSNLLIYPYGFNNITADPIFPALAKVYTHDNKYKPGVAIQTVGYNVNGTSDDWMYAGAKILAFTPEVGPAIWGFWPPRSAIDGLNKESVWLNLATALTPLHSGFAEDMGKEEVSAATFSIPVRLTKFGLKNGDFTVSLVSVNPQATVLQPSSTVVRDLKQFDSQDIAFPVRLAPGTRPGEPLLFLLQVNNGSYTKTDTLRRIFPGVQSVVAKDDFLSAAQWTGRWQTTTATFYSVPTSLTDSPNGNYAPNTVYASELINAVHIPANAVQPRIEFWGKWSIQPDYDYAQVSIADNVDNWLSLCGRYTTVGESFGNPSEPLYTGVQNQWVEERVDLSGFTGNKLRIQVKLTSKSNGGWDGFYMDDFRVVYYDPTIGLTKTIDLEAKDFKLTQRPNPASEQVTIDWTTAGDQLSGEGQLLGRTKWNQPVNLNNTITQTIEVGAWPTGVYITNLMLPNGQMVTGKVVVRR
jgi:carboxypeptidase T